MTPYNVIIQPEAEADLDDAFEYLEAQKPTLGFDLLAEVVSKDFKELYFFMLPKPNLRYCFFCPLFD